MPNNKGGVPMYNENPQYSATISPQIPQGSPAMFGTQLAKETAGLGDAMGKLGTNLVEYAVKMQERDDNAFILEKDNQMRAAMSDLLYNPQTGLANQKGKNAFGVTQTYDEELEKITQGALSEIKNPVLQAKLQEKNMQWVNNLRTNVAKHEGGERFTFYSNQITGGRVNAVNIGSQIGGLEGMQSTASIISGLKVNAKELLGWDDVMADNWEIESNGEAFSLIADEYVKKGDIGGLQTLVDRYGDKVPGKVLADARTKLGVINQQQDAAKEVEALIAAHPELINEDGELDETRAYALIDQINGENAPDRIERVFVGGGGGAYVADSSLDPLIDSAAAKYKVDPLVVAAIARIESFGGQHTRNGQIVTSPVGALGAMQLMPDTAASLGVDPYDKAQNVEGGAKYISQMLETFGGDLRKAVAAYNAGPAAVKQYGGVPPYKETQGYVERFFKEYEDLKASASAGGSSVTPYQMPTQGANIDEQVGNLKDTWKHGVMDWVGGVVKDVFHYSNPTISSAARSSTRNAQVSTSGDKSWHVHNDALDVVFDEGQDLNQAQMDALVKYFKDTGMFEEVLYHDFGSGYHLHLGGLKTSTPPLGAGGGRWEERKVSGYNPVANNAMKAYIKRKAALISGDNERKITTWSNALLQNENVQNARDMSEINVEMDKMGIPWNKRSKVMSRVNIAMQINNSHVARVRGDTQWTDSRSRKAQQDANDSVSAWMLDKIAKGEDYTAKDVMDLPAFNNMDPGNALSIVQHLQAAEAKNDSYGGWYQGENKDTFEKTVASLRKSIQLDDMEIPNIRRAVTTANLDRKKNGQDPLTSSQIQELIIGQTANWKKKKSWHLPWTSSTEDSGNRTSQVDYAGGQYVDNDGVVHDADGTVLEWNETYNRFMRP